MYASLTNFAGWGPCGPFNTIGVFDFYWLAVGLLIFVAVISIGWARLGEVVFKHGRPWTYVGLGLFMIPALLLDVLALYINLSEVFDFLRGYVDYCDPVVGWQGVVFTLTALVLFASTAYVATRLKRLHQKRL